MEKIKGSMEDISRYSRKEARESGAVESFLREDTEKKTYCLYAAVDKEEMK
jgi:hypothetical protein